MVLKAYIKSRLSKSLREMVYREIRLHGQVRFLDGVTEILGWFEDDLQIVLVLEHCTGGDVYRRLVLEGGQMSTPSAATEVLNPLVKAMVGVHRKKLSHRDLKPENLFYCCSPEGDRKLKIGDFGLASDLHEMRDRVGTLDYMAPEILLQQDETAFSTQGIGEQAEGADSGSMPKVADGPYTSKVDVWAVGIIAYELLTGRPPFEVNSPHQTAMLIVWGSPEFPDYVSAAAREFILMALQKDPEERPTMEELLRHPFLTNYTEVPLFTNSKRSQFLKARASFKMPKQELTKDDDEGDLDEDASAFQKRQTDVVQVPRTKGRVRRGVTTRDMSLASHGTGESHLKAKVKPLKSRNKPRGQNSFKSTPLPASAPLGAPVFVKPATKWTRGPSRMSDDSCYTDIDSAGKISKPSAAPAAPAPKKVRMSDHSGVSDISSNGHSINLSNPTPGRLSIQSAPGPPRSILKQASDSDATPGADAANYRGSAGTNAKTTPYAKMRAFSMRTMSLTGTETGMGGDPWDRKATLFNRFFSSLMCGRASMDEDMCGSGAEKPMQRVSAGGSERGSVVGQGGYPLQGRKPRSRRGSATSGGHLSTARTSDGTTVSVAFSTDELQPRNPSQSSETSEASRGAAMAGGSVRSSKRSVKKSASRIGMGLSRLLSRIGLDDHDSTSAPWNTNGAHLVGMTPQLRNAPDLDTLEAMKANAKSSTRNRMKEYMVRRGGDNETTRQSLAHENMPPALVAAEAKLPKASANGSGDVPQESFPDTTADVADSAAINRLRQARRSGA